MLILHPPSNRSSGSNDPRRCAPHLVGRCTLPPAPGLKTAEHEQDDGGPSVDTTIVKKALHETDDETVDTRSTSTSTSSSSSSSSSRTARRIRFGSVSVHSHALTLGDNPSVSNGLPVTLEWKAVDSKAFDMEEYETTCRSPKRRKNCVRKFSTKNRQDILEESGFSRETFEQVAKDIMEIKESRAKCCLSLDSTEVFSQMFAELKQAIEDSKRIEEYLLHANSTKRNESRYDASNGVGEYELMTSSSGRKERKTYTPIPFDDFDSLRSSKRKSKSKNGASIFAKLVCKPRKGCF